MEPEHRTVRCTAQLPVHRSYLGMSPTCHTKFGTFPVHGTTPTQRSSLDRNAASPLHLLPEVVPSPGETGQTVRLKSMPPHSRISDRQGFALLRREARVEVTLELRSSTPIRILPSRLITKTAILSSLLTFLGMEYHDTTVLDILYFGILESHSISLKFEIGLTMSMSMMSCTSKISTKMTWALAVLLASQTSCVGGFHAVLPGSTGFSLSIARASVQPLENSLTTCTCCACGLKRDRDDFSKTTWKNKSEFERRCAQCVVEGNPIRRSTSMPPAVVATSDATPATVTSQRSKKAATIAAEETGPETLEQRSQRYRTAIRRCGGQWAKAIQLLRRMISEKDGTDLFCANAAISACSKTGQWNLALSILGELPSLGLKPDVISFNLAITACANGGNWEKALELFEAMQV